MIAGPRIRLALLATALSWGGALAPVTAAPARAQQAGGECLTCHLSLDDERLSAPATGWDVDVHQKAGLACAACHGGEAGTTDERVAHAGMLARPPRERIPELCGRCHSNPEFMRNYNPALRVDQVDEYYTSRHGQLLVQGDPNVAVCIDCHTPHTIQPASEPSSSIYPANIPDKCGSCHADAERMGRYGIPTDQLEEYKTSIHWRTLEDRGDLTAPVCNDCHGNHGAVPPGHSSVGRVCSECHFQIGEYFAESPHDTAFVGIDRPGCATCHGNHAIQAADDDLLGLGDRSTCIGSGCHTDTDRGGLTAASMRTFVDSLLKAHVRSDSILEAAGLVGMPVDRARFELTKIQNAIVGARAVMHTTRLDSLSAKIDEGLAVADAGYEAGEAAFAELRTRRLGLAVSSGVILVLVVGLLTRIRDLGVE